MKKLLATIMALVLALTLLPTTALATDSETKEVTNANDLTSALSATGVTTIKLTSDLTVTGSVGLTNKTVTIDLNGHSITRSKDNANSSDELIYPALNISGGKVTLKDSSSNNAGKISISVSNGVAEATKAAAVLLDSKAELTVEGGTLTATADDNTNVVGVWVKGNSTFTMTGGKVAAGNAEYANKSYGVYIDGAANSASSFTLTGGEITANAAVGEKNCGYGVFVSGGTEGKDLTANSSVTNVPFGAKFTMNGGKITTSGFGVSSTSDTGNGTEITIQGGEINGKVMAIYHPQVGTMNITGGKLLGYSGIEVKAGEVTVDGKDVTINVTESLKNGQGYYEIGRIDNKDNAGNSTRGYAVAVVNNGEYQHVGAKVTLANGHFNSRVGISDDASTNKSQNAKYTLTITGGTYTNGGAVNTGYDEKSPTNIYGTVAAADTLTITGGLFEYNVAKTVPDGYAVVKDGDNSYYVVAKSDIKKVDKKEPTCEVKGFDAYYTIESNTEKAYYYTADTNVKDANGITINDADKDKTFYVYAKDKVFELPAKVHDYQVVENTAATEQKDGWVVYQCSNDTSHTYTVKINATGTHSMEKHNAVAASCKAQTNGMDVYWECTDCGRLYADENGTKEINRTNMTYTVDNNAKVSLIHSWTDAHTWTDDSEVNATCTTDGLTAGKHCTICNAWETIQKKTLATGHELGGKMRSNETQHWYTCTKCNAEEQKADHTWDAGVVTKEATNDTKGTKLLTCTACGYTKTEEFENNIVAEVNNGVIQVKVDGAAVDETKKTATIDATSSNAAGAKAAAITVAPTVTEKLKNSEVETVTIKTNLADLTLDEKALATVLAGTDVNGHYPLEITITESHPSATKQQFEITATVNGTNVFVKSNGYITVTVPKDAPGFRQQYVCYCTDNGGHVRMGGIGYSNKTFSWRTNHFSTFVIETETVSTSRAYIDLNGSSSATTTTVKKSSSATTFDAGVGIYAVSAILSVTGMAWVGKKKH